MKLKYLSFEQPIGEFAMTVMSVKQILSISIIERREFDQISLDSKGGPQREASISRVNEISKYSETSDATFPTPILLALPEDSYTINEEFIEIDDTFSSASVVDGQHRLLGLAKSKYIAEFMLPVVFILDATEEQKALIFTIINGKQTRVSASVIYDLFNVFDGRSPFKTAHEIARAMNQNEDSPFYRRLKMLGKKTKESTETLSQGKFVTQLVKLISNNPSEDFNRARSNQPILARPSAIFNGYYVENKDEIILKIMLNVFKAVETNFYNEWNSPDKYILSKTTGYTGIIKALPILYTLGQEKKMLNFEFFDNIFRDFNRFLKQNEIELTSEFFPPNSVGENKLRDKIIESIGTV